MTTPTANQAPLGTTNALATKDEIRIYVACLAAYNSGYLHGQWIDATQGEDHIWTETRAMLAASPIPHTDEWAIHDYEGFEGADLSETWTKPAPPLKIIQANTKALKILPMS